RYNSVNTDESEPESEGRGDRQHYQRKRGARHRAIVEFFHCADQEHREVRVDGPNRLPYVVQKAFSAGTLASDHERDSRRAEFRSAKEVFNNHPPTHRGGCRLWRPVVVNFFSDANAFPPQASGRRISNAVSNRCGWFSPQFTSDTI